MKKFWGYVSNGFYSVGCSGQTVYLYDEADREVAKFKDIQYGYLPILSPTDDIFVVKSTCGKLAIYFVKDKCLLKKFTFSNVDGSQDDGGCFSEDGMLFYNIERYPASYSTRLTIYNTTDWTVQCHLFENDDSIELTAIEADEAEVFVLGFSRDKKRDCNAAFCAKLQGEHLMELHNISQEKHDVYSSYYNLKMHGFTEKSFEWSDWRYLQPNRTLADACSMELSLKDIWENAD